MAQDQLLLWLWVLQGQILFSDEAESRRVQLGGDNGGGWDRNLLRDCFRLEKRQPVETGGDRVWGEERDLNRGRQAAWKGTSTSDPPRTSPSSSCFCYLRGSTSTVSKINHFVFPSQSLKCHKSRNLVFLELKSLTLNFYSFLQRFNACR